MWFEQWLEGWFDSHWLPFWLLAQTFVLLLVLLVVWRQGRAKSDARESGFEALIQGQERLEQVWRLELQQYQSQLRHEISQGHQALRQELLQGNEQFREAVARDALLSRGETATGLEKFADNFSQRLALLTQANETRLQDLRDTVEKRLEQMQMDNRASLEKMRHTVDEKLHATLEQRLGESFRQVSDRLEAVHKGLGEMQTLASGVGDLKRVLTNVKTRGTWGEVQLMRLVEDVMTPAQYATHVKTVPNSNAAVELAIRLPGAGGEHAPVWLPVDAKFPKEEYERLQQAHDNSDEAAQRTATVALGRALEIQARLIADKYLAPPHTTDFAIMFLPSESLYAEVLRLPGMLERLQGHRIVVAGPVNFAALLNSLQMGFRTLAIEQRSSEVWQILRGVKTEFGKFGGALHDMRKSLETAANRLGQTETRTRVMLRTLKDVEALDHPQVADKAAQLDNTDDEADV